MSFFEKIINLIYKIFPDRKKLIDNNQNFEEELFNKYGTIEEIQKYNLKILFITDTHDCLAYDNETLDFIKNAKDYDCCILLGDHSSKDLEEILKIIPKEKIYGVLGNHDGWERYQEFSINNIDGKVIEIKNIKIAGISGSYKYKDSDNYAMYTHEESIEIANKMEEADILVSHDKPFIKKEFGDAHDGLKGITEYIYKNNISIHVHGHLHEEKETVLKNGTKSICLYKAKIIDFSYI